VKIVGIQRGRQGVAQVNSVNLEENCGDYEALRVGGKVRWTFRGHRKGRGCRL